MSTGTLAPLSVLCIALALFGCADAHAQSEQAAPAIGKAASLAAAVARAAGESGWRTDALADGRVAALGVEASGGVVQVVGVACGTQGRPEIAVDSRGAAKLPRALIVEAEELTISFAIDPNGSAATGADALLADLLFPSDDAAKMWLDKRGFPTSGARAALGAAAKDCTARFGWDYGNDDDRQLVWIMSSSAQDGPLITFGKPWSGWASASLACDRRSKALLVNSTTLPRGIRHGQAAPLTIEIGKAKLQVDAKAALTKESDVPGLLVARFRQPRRVLDLLGDAAEITFRARAEKLTVPARGLGPLLGRFEKGCGF